MIAYIHFSSDEWSSDKRANVDKFLEKLKQYLIELGDITGRKIANNSLEFDDTRYKDNINKIFENLVVNYWNKIWKGYLFEAAKFRFR